jgi:hypothetical protein
MNGKIVVDVFGMSTEDGELEDLIASDVDEIPEGLPETAMIRVAPLGEPERASAFMASTLFDAVEYLEAWKRWKGQDPGFYRFGPPDGGFTGMILTSRNLIAAACNCERFELWDCCPDRALIKHLFGFRKKS